MNRLSATLVLFAACAVVSAQPKLAFEVVSIKPVPRPTPETVRNGTSRVGFNIQGDRVELVGYPLGTILARAFRVEFQQVDLRGLGGTQSFEIQAKLPQGATPDQVPEMLQTMLAERFKLAYHRESREYPVTVVTGKNGMKLPRLPEDTQESTKTENGRMTHIGTVASLFPVMNSFGGFDQMIDQTGLEGKYTWVQILTPTPGRDFQESLRESFEAMLDAAGLKLESRKLPKETIVVDRLEPVPTEN